MTTINGCFMRHASLGQGGTRPRATCCILFSAIKPSIKLDPSLFTNFSNAHESRRHLTPPPLSVRRLCLRPRRSSFAVAAGNHAAAAAKSFLRVRLPLIGLHTDRPSTSERRCVDSPRVFTTNDKDHCKGQNAMKFVLESLQSVQSKLLDSPFKFQKTRGRYQNKIELGGLLRISQRHRIRVGVRASASGTVSNSFIMSESAK